MQMRTWSIVYDDARKSLSLYVDEWCLGTINDGNIFGRGRTAIFGPNGIATLYLGPYAYYAGGVVTAVADDQAFYGLFGSFQLWDRAMNSTEISKLAASPRTLSGNEEGLAVFWSTDSGYGKAMSRSRAIAPRSFLFSPLSSLLSPDLRDRRSRELSKFIF